MGDGNAEGLTSMEDIGLNPEADGYIVGAPENGIIPVYVDSAIPPSLNSDRAAQICRENECRVLKVFLTRDNGISSEPILTHRPFESGSGSEF